MNHRTVAAALAAAGGMAVAGFAHAGADVGSYFVSPGILWVSPDNKLDADAAYGARLGVGKVINQNWDFEFAYSDTKHASGIAGPTGDFKLGFTELDLKRVFRRDQRFNPFLDVGIGLVTGKRQNVVSSKSNEAALKLGLGFLAGAAQSARAQIVGDAGLRLDKFGAGIGRTVDPYVGLGVRLYLGGKSPAAPAPPAPTAAAVAAPPPPAPPPAPVDSDGDGVPDNADRCPNTPAGTRVDATGCELDGDRDGVVDRLDRCPTTPAGDKVDAVGCGLTIALQVNFDTNSATIKSDSYAELDNFVEFLKAVPSASGALEGHTDSVGSDAYNQSLSQRRADSVKAYVVGKGIVGGRIEVRGYGESRPVADNTTTEGRAQNRRVQFVRSSLQQ